MPTSSPPDWEAIRHAYVETDARTQDICARAGITAAQLKGRCAKDGWRRKLPRPFGSFNRTATPPAPGPLPEADPQPPAANPPRATISAEPAPAAPRKPPAPSPSTAALTRRRLIARLVAAISLKLEQLERRMSQDLKAIEAGTAATATDHERETRAIGALIDNLGKITEIEADLATRNSGKSAAATDLGREADRFRRELAERLRSLAKPAAASP